MTQSGRVQNLARNNAGSDNPKKEPVDLGAILRSARESKGWNIDTIADDLCIRSCYLTAIEHNRLDEMPDGVFAVGFFKNYADYLGLDADTLAPEFRKFIGLDPVERRTGVDKPSVPACDYAANVSAAKKKPSTGLMPAFAGGAGVLAVWASFSFVSPTDVQPPAAELALDAASLAVADAALSDADTVILASARSDALVQSEATTDQAAVQRSGSRIISMFPAVQAQGAPALSDIALTAVEDVWLSLEKVDGTLIWEGVLPGGESYTPDVDGAFRLTTSNAGALRLVTGGAEESLGERGTLLDGAVYGGEQLLGEGSGDQSVAVDVQASSAPAAETGSDTGSEAE